MTDDRELAGLDPFDLLDQEAARLDRFFSELAEGAWGHASRCADWTIRDVLGHLAASENYHRSCLEGTVKSFLASFAERGADGIDSANALGVADFASAPVAAVLEYWRKSGSDNRRRFAERDGGIVDTSIGDYPCRWQAFHVASELATHADDIAVPVTEDEQEPRRAWRARFSRFALSEAKPELQVHRAGTRTVVSDRSTTVEVDDDELIEAVMGRLGKTSRIDKGGRAMLSTML